MDHGRAFVLLCGDNDMTVSWVEYPWKCFFRVRSCPVCVSGGCGHGIKFRLMSEPEQSTDIQSDNESGARQPGQTPAIFGSRPPERASYPVFAWAVAALVVLVF